jgi:DNA-binding transcriptional MocR family regulator
MREFPASPITALIDGSPQYDLGESYAPHLSVADILDPAELAGLSLGYGTSAGDAELRTLIAARLGIPAEQVLLTAGASAALFLVALLHSDGEILVGVPCFPPMLDALRGLGARVVTVPARFEDGYRVDLDAFRDGLSAHTRLVMFASPQNPSGVSITRGEVSGMLAAMSRRCPEAVLLVDETYREATYGSARAALTFAGLSDLCLAVQGLRRPGPAHRLAHRGRSAAARTAQAGEVQFLGLLRRSRRVPRRPAADARRSAARVPGRADGPGPHRGRALDRRTGRPAALAAA